MSDDKAIRQRGPYSKSEKTRCRLIDAATDIVGEIGFQKMSVRKIAERAGVAVGVVNYHFGTKKALSHVLMDQFRADIQDTVARPLHADGFFAHQKKFLTTWINYVRANPSFIRVMEEVRYHEPEVYEAAIAENIEWFSYLIRRGIRRAELMPMSDEDVRAGAYFILGIHRFVDRLLQVDDRAAEEIAESFDHVLRASMVKPEL